MVIFQTNLQSAITNHLRFFLFYSTYLNQYVLQLDAKVKTKL